MAQPLPRPNLLPILDRISKIPIVATLGFRDFELAPGQCSAVVPRDRRYDGIFGSSHGGLLMTIAENLAAFAILTLTESDERMAISDMNIRFLAPALSDVHGVARVVKLGQTLVPVEVNLYDDLRRHVAVSQVTFVRLADRRRGPRRAPTPH